LFELHKATIDDLPALMELIDQGIAALAAQGSPQWQNGYGPSEDKIRADILKQESYLLKTEGTIAAAAALVSGTDPVYTGQRLSAKLLHALEEVARNEGIFDLRIDTYQANTAMQRNITTAGYTFCGHIEFPIPDGARLAYQKLL